MPLRWAFHDDVRSGIQTRLSRRAAPYLTCEFTHHSTTRTPRRDAHTSGPSRVPLTTHDGPCTFVERNGSISFSTPHHHDRPSTHLRQRQRRASFKVGAPSAGHQAAVSDEESTFHLHLSRPPHLALESLTHQSSFLSLFEAPIALITPRTGSEAERKHRVRATRGRGPAYKHTNTLALWA